MLKIVSNFPLTKESIPCKSLDDLKTDQIDLLIFIHKNSFFKSYMRQAGEVIKIGKEFLAFPNENILLFRKSYLGMNFYACIKNLGGKPTELLISSSFRYARIPLRDLPPMGHIIQSLIALKLLAKGFAIAHMALIDSPYGGISVSSYPDIGKTTTAILLSQKKGFKALADDLSVIDSKGNCYGGSFSHINIWAAAEYALTKERFKVPFIRIRSKVGEIFRIFGYIFPHFSKIAFLLHNIDVTKISGRNFNIGSGWVKAKYLFILEGSNKEESIPLNYEEAKRKLLNINRKEYFMFYFDNNPLFLVYSYIYKDFDFFKYLEKRDFIFSNFAKFTKPFLIRARKPYEFTDLILELLSNAE